MFESDSLRLQHSGEDLASLRSKDIAISAGYFLNDVVCAKHTQESADAPAATSFFLERSGSADEEQGLEIAVTKAVDAELSVANGSEEVDIVLRPGSQGADALAVVDRWRADGA